MKKEYLPYYISRAILCITVCMFAFGFSLQGLIWTVLLYSGFNLYIHSGWFSIDLSNPFFPLRRDGYSQSIQRKSLIASILAAVWVFLIGSYLLPIIGYQIQIATFLLPISVTIYFLTQFGLFLRQS